MNHFTISQLQDYSGIKAHTIRMWEARYQVFLPARSAGNTRYYNNNQLRRLLNIVSLMNFEFKVSELCKMTDQQLTANLDIKFPDQQDIAPDIDYLITQLLSSAIDFNEIRFEKIFSTCLLRFGLKETYLNVIYPMLVRLGLLWSKDHISPAHEHFVVNLIKKKISTAIDTLPIAAADAKSWILFLPENEYHEMGLLIAYYLIRQARHKVYYIGANVPISSLDQTIDLLQSDHLLTFFVHKRNGDKEIDLLNKLSESIAPRPIYVACNPAHMAGKCHSINFHQIHDLEHLTQLLH